MATPKPDDTAWHITVQRRAGAEKCPSAMTFRRWARSVLFRRVASAEVTFRLVTPEEMAALNQQWRHKNYPTNVLSFPLSAPEDPSLTGDIIICAAVVREEAATQQKPLRAHWAHMVVHGLLHLLGYDHEQEADADRMEALEIQILAALGFSNPYNQGEKNLSCPG